MALADRLTHRLFTTFHAKLNVSRETVKCATMVPGPGKLVMLLSGCKQHGDLNQTVIIDSCCRSMLSNKAAGSVSVR